MGCQQRVRGISMQSVSWPRLDTFGGARNQFRTRVTGTLYALWRMRSNSRRSIVQYQMERERTEPASLRYFLPTWVRRNKADRIGIQSGEERHSVGCDRFAGRACTLGGKTTQRVLNGSHHIWIAQIKEQEKVHAHENPMRNCSGVSRYQVRRNARATDRQYGLI